MPSDYRTYKRRWGVLAAVVITLFAAVTQRNCYLAIAASAAEYFEADDVKMDYIVLLGSIITAPGMFVALFIVNKIGLKVTKTNT